MYTTGDLELLSLTRLQGPRRLKPRQGNDKVPLRGLGSPVGDRKQSRALESPPTSPVESDFILSLGPTCGKRLHSATPNPIALWRALPHLKDTWAEPLGAVSRRPTCGRRLQTANPGGAAGRADGRHGLRRARRGESGHYKALLCAFRGILCFCVLSEQADSSSGSARRSAGADRGRSRGLP